MPLQTTVFFEQVLRKPYEHLLQTQIAKDLLSGNFRLHGTQLNAGDTVVFDGAQLDSGEVARLLMAFDGTRIHQQNQHDVGEDDAPPGIYFTATNAEVIHEGHKNRVGIYQETAADRSLFLDAIDEGNLEFDRALHVDHFFLRDQAPELLGTIAFALCAMTAHQMSYAKISLIAGGGRGYDPNMIGYLFWPKLGFDAPIEDGEVEDAPLLANCETVQEIVAIDPQWWRGNGSQRWMEFDLAPRSESWEKLLDYLREKELL